MMQKSHNPYLYKILTSQINHSILSTIKNSNIYSPRNVEKGTVLFGSKWVSVAILMVENVLRSIYCVEILDKFKGYASFSPPCTFLHKKSDSPELTNPESVYIESCYIVMGDASNRVIFVNPPSGYM